MKLQLLLFLPILTCPLLAQSSRTVALLDLAPRNGETSSRLESAVQCLQVAGVPYVVTEDIAAATAHHLIVTSSIIQNGTLNNDEQAALYEHVEFGGVLFAPRVTDPDMFALFGISAATASVVNYALTWNQKLGDSALRWIDDPMEQTISLGRETYEAVIQTRVHTLAGGQALAHYGDGSTATVINTYGAGVSYVLGASLKDVIMRPVLNLDFDAQRSFSNGFEPSADTIMLLFRGIYQKHLPYATWTHTSPYNSKASMILTHDVDARTAMEIMHRFAWLDRDTGFTAHFLVTTHYIDDDVAGDYYTPFIANIQAVKDAGHRIGSHSVGHFPDFGDEDIVTLGAPGNTMQTYQPAHQSGVTSDATVYGELEVSRDLLTTDVDALVRVFRTGHLAFHNQQTNVLEAMGYAYDTSRSANDVLTAFPYRQKYDRSLNGFQSEVWEIPLLISDVFASDPISADNYPEKVAIWQEALTKNSANHAPTVLLVHPNRDFKVDAQDLLFAALPDDILRIDMERFGDYWRRRVQTSFETQVKGQILTMTIPVEQLPLDPMLSFVVTDGADLSQVRVISEAGQELEFHSAAWNTTDLILYQAAMPFMRLLSPNGGETLENGNHIEVNWLSGADMEQVELAWSDDDGANWHAIAANINNTGSFTWVLDTGVRDQVRLRVREQGAVPADISDTSFNVVLDGDLNQDNTVDETDLNALAAFVSGNLEQGEDPFTGPLSRADLDEDQSVNARDLVLLALAAASAE